MRGNCALTAGVPAYFEGDNWFLPGHLLCLLSMQNLNQAYARHFLQPKADPIQLAA